jgi:hypothetical protein
VLRNSSFGYAKVHFLRWPSVTGLSPAILSSTASGQGGSSSRAGAPLCERTRAPRHAQGTKIVLSRPEYNQGVLLFSGLATHNPNSALRVQWPCLLDCATKGATVGVDYFTSKSTKQAFSATLNSELKTSHIRMAHINSCHVKVFCLPPAVGLVELIGPSESNSKVRFRPRLQFQTLFGQGITNSQTSSASVMSLK